MLLFAGKRLPAEAQLKVSVTRQRQRWSRTDKNRAGNYKWSGDWWVWQGWREDSKDRLKSHRWRHEEGRWCGTKTWHLFGNKLGKQYQHLQMEKCIHLSKIINYILVAALKTYDDTYVLHQPVVLCPSFRVFPNIITVSSFRDTYGHICHSDASTSTEYFIDSNVGHPSLSHPAQSFVTWDRYF